MGWEAGACGAGSTDCGSRHLDFYPDSIAVGSVSLGKPLNLSELPFHHLLNYTLSESCRADAEESACEGAWPFKRDCTHGVTVKWTEKEVLVLKGWGGGRMIREANRSNHTQGRCFSRGSC